MNLSIKIWLYYTVMDLNVKANIIKTLVKNKNTNAPLLLLWIKNELQLKKVFAVSNFLNNHYLLSLQRKINLKIGASSCYYYYLILMLILTFKYHMYESQISSSLYCRYPLLPMSKNITGISFF